MKIVDETSSKLGVESEVLIPIENTEANELSGDVSSTPVSVDGHFMLLEGLLGAQDYDTRLKYPVIAVHGLEGVGRTQLATRFVYGRVSHTRSIRAVDLRTPSNSIDLLEGWMLTPGHENGLLVLDNFDDIHVKVDRFLPVGASGSVLVTTRDRNVIGSVATTGFALIAMDTWM
ncbi:hypothetical protein BDR22DRAFT_890192 [Usnea florida]